MNRAARGFTFVELLVVLAVVAVLACVALPLLPRPRINHMRAACANNAKQIGVGFYLYKKEVRRFLGDDYIAALTRVDDAAVNGPEAWIDPAATEPGAPDGTEYGARMLVALADLLVTAGLNDPNLFACPSSQGVEYHKGTKWLSDDRQRSLIGPRHVSYSLSFGVKGPDPKPDLIVYGDRVRYGARARLDVGADKAGFASGVTAEEARGANHHGDGFNFLYADGHVKWQKAPTADHPPEGARLLVEDNGDATDNVFLVTARDGAPTGDDTGLY